MPKRSFLIEEYIISENFLIEIKSLKLLPLSKITPFFAKSKNSSTNVQWTFLLLFSIGKPIILETLKIKTLLLRMEVKFFSVINLFFE